LTLRNIDQHKISGLLIRGLVQAKRPRRSPAPVAPYATSHRSSSCRMASLTGRRSTPSSRRSGKELPFGQNGHMVGIQFAPREQTPQGVGSHGRIRSGHGLGSSRGRSPEPRRILRLVAKGEATRRFIERRQCGAAWPSKIAPPVYPPKTPGGGQQSVTSSDH
jgi:hypothetical protein